MTDDLGGGLTWPLLLAWTTAAVVATTILTAAAISVISTARRSPAGGWTSLTPILPGFTAGGLTLLVTMPGLLAADGFGYFAALGFLSPWTLGLGATGWLRGRPAMAALTAVATSGVLFLAVALSAELHAYFSPPPDTVYQPPGD
ncbi:hypothetical protein [Paractinoplanes atraurantiacus]|uniref:Uncharacterized protein n=1 Tax=Paractinoplanes atraurantiacus TaxID=1036182 RepID=A0A285GXX2_9ACTN|nr:hypothetical protein [Actinoplanes atraurantiacus]SNY28362.1 hypothetical protein SAMN05421748_10369 [Actinoplanes atraurantiacus]